MNWQISESYPFWHIWRRPDSRLTGSKFIHETPLRKKRQELRVGFSCGKNRNLQACKQWRLLHGCCSAGGQLFLNKDVQSSTKGFTGIHKSEYLLLLVHVILKHQSKRGSLMFYAFSSYGSLYRIYVYGWTKQGASVSARGRQVSVGSQSRSKGQHLRCVVAENVECRLQFGLE